MFQNEATPLLTKATFFLPEPEEPEGLQPVRKAAVRASRTGRTGFIGGCWDEVAGAFS
jgi:hypothetical protein